MSQKLHRNGSARGLLLLKRALSLKHLRRSVERRVFAVSDSKWPGSAATPFCIVELLFRRLFIKAMRACNRRNYTIFCAARRKRVAHTRACAFLRLPKHGARLIIAVCECECNTLNKQRNSCNGSAVEVFCRSLTDFRAHGTGCRVLICCRCCCWLPWKLAGLGKNAGERNKRRTPSKVRFAKFMQREAECCTLDSHYRERKAMI